MQKIPKQEYTAEFREQAIKRIRECKSVGAVVKEMGLVAQTLRNWLRAFDAALTRRARSSKTVGVR